MAKDPLYNSRRRAKTFVKQLERLATSQNKRQRERTQKYIDQMNANIKASYIKGSSRQKAEAAAKRINNLIGFTGKQSQRKAADQLFIREMGRASVTGESPFIGDNAGLKVKAFMRVTQRMWEGSQPSQRFDAVKKELGFQTVEQAFNYVMETQKEDIEAILNDNGLSEREKYDILMRRVIIL